MLQQATSAPLGCVAVGIMTQLAERWPFSW
jgi:hypothetical protein